MRAILRVPFLNLGAISDFEAIDTKFWINIGLSTFLTNNVSVNSNWVHPPGQPPGISSKTLPGGSGFDF